MGSPSSSSSSRLPSEALTCAASSAEDDDSCEDCTGGRPPDGKFCYGTIKNKLKQNFKIIAGIGMVTVLYQVFGTIFGCVVARAIRKSKDQKEEARQESIARQGPPNF